jgi:hypothetical protein
MLVRSGLSSKRKAIRTLTVSRRQRTTPSGSRVCQGYRIIRELIYLIKSIDLIYVFWDPSIIISKNNQKKKVTTNQSLWCMIKCFCENKAIPKNISGNSSLSFEKYIYLNFYDPVLETMDISELILHLYDTLPLAKTLREVGLSENFFKLENIHNFSEISYVCGCKDCIVSFKKLCQKSIRKKNIKTKFLRLILTWFPQLNNLDSDLDKFKNRIENIISIKEPLTDPISASEDDHTHQFQHTTRCVFCILV